MKAERDHYNLLLSQDTPPVLPERLVTLHPSAFVRKFLELYCVRITKFGPEESINQIEDNHRLLCKTYSKDGVLRAAIGQYDCSGATLTS